MLGSNPYAAIGCDDGWCSFDTGLGFGSGGAELGERVYEGRTAGKFVLGWIPNPRTTDKTTQRG